MNATGGQHPPFLQKIVGFAETDMGMGLVVEAVRAADGSSAPTVAELAGRGDLDQGRRAELDRFLDGMAASPVVVADLNPLNVVYGCPPGGPAQFVLSTASGTRT